MTTAYFPTKEEALECAKKKLYELVTPTSLLLLSGGNTPKPLYKKIAEENIMHPGAIALIDERYGEPFHENSNGRLLRDCGITDFYPILREDKEIQEIAQLYDRKLNALFKEFGHRVAVMGIGPDGHTAGLPAGISNYKFPISNKDLVVSLDNFPGPQKERITTTFNALEKIDNFIVIVFGEDKKEALHKMMQEGSLEEIPARFYNRPDVSERTLLITDQKV